jgi:hypothetical protein
MAIGTDNEGIQPVSSTAPWKIDIDKVRAAAAGRWVEILGALAGLTPDQLSGRHQPCPRPGCGGTDRFRAFDDVKETGGVFCNSCHDSKNGDGFSTLQWVLSISFIEAVKRVNAYLGHPGGNPTERSPGEPRDPAANLEFLPWNRLQAALWCRHKPPVTVEGLESCHARIARYRGQWPVMALPIFGRPEVGDASIVGWAMFALNGGTLPVYRKGQEPEWKKVKLTAGSGPGWLGQVDRIASGDVTQVWKPEGLSDLLTLASQALPPDHAVITNAFGSKEDPAKLPDPLLAALSGSHCNVIHDCDTPGQEGATFVPRDQGKPPRPGWAPAIAAHAASCRNVVLPYPIVPDHGPDLRDWFVAGGTFENLQEIANHTATTAAATDSLEPITNSNREDDGENVRFVPLPMIDVTRRIFNLTNGWPRRVGPGLFVHEGGNIAWLDNTPSLFGWMAQRTGVIEWRRTAGCVTKEEVFHELKRSCIEYAAVESMPHEPPIANHYYSHPELPVATGAAATALVERFSPATEEDKWLILAMFASVFWGGKGGSRPAFVITSDAGRGSGKSKITDMLSHLAGGCIELSSNEDATIMRQRLLSPEGMNKRIARLDNVKSLKFSWSDLESLITAPAISGKRMYYGEATRPNNLVWLITLNGVSLSTDMAQRAIIIKIKRPPRVAEWESDTLQFIDDNRQAIISDLIALLRLPRRPLECRTRWAAWEREVLGRLNFEDLGAIQDLIAHRSSAADTEAEEIQLVEEFFVSRLNDLHYNAEADKIHIPSSVAGEWYIAATNEKRTIMGATKILCQFVSEGRAVHLRVNPTKKFGRGFLWNGEIDGNANYEIENRIREKSSSRNSKSNNWWDR